MKGKIKVKVEVTDEMGRFPVTNSWEFNQDNSLEGIDEWLDLFSKILYTQGFAPYKLDIIEEDANGADVNLE